MAEPIPKARGSTLLGPLADFLRDPPSYIKQVAAYGDLVQVSLGGLEVVYVFHPEYARHILLSKRSKYVKGSLMARTELVLGKGLVTAEGDAWRSQRRRMAASFSPAHTDAFADQIAQMTDRFCDTLGGVRRVNEDTMHLTLSIALHLLFGQDQSSRFEEMGDAFDELLQFFAATSEFFVQLPLWVPTPRNRRFLKARASLDQAVQEIVDTRRASSDQGTDLLSRIIAAPGGDEASSALIQDEVRTLMIAGHETTALALTFSLWFLSAESDRQASLRTKINAITGGGPVQGAHLSQLSFVEPIIKEAIRILPPVPIITREPLADDTIGPHHVPAKTTLIIAPYRTQKDPRWFSEPDDFRPERWTPELVVELPRFAYMPFGGGPRICIGMRLAMVESILIIAEVVRRFEVSRTPSTRLSLKPGVTLRPDHPLELDFQQAS